jgi:hypothetical protein
LGDVPDSLALIGLVTVRRCETVGDGRVRLNGCVLKIAAHGRSVRDSVRMALLAALPDEAGGRLYAGQVDGI